MNPSILNTPSSIYDAVTAHFIYASLKVTSTNPVEVEIELEPNLPKIYLFSAVNKDIFEKTLYSYSLQIAEMAESTTPRPYLDPSKFSVAEPLTDWKRFRRVVCASEGKDCLDVIIDFLLHPSGEKFFKVSHLGFEPESLIQRLSDKDLEYFEDLPKKISGMNFEERKEIIKQVQLKYPTVFNHFKEEFTALTKEVKFSVQAIEKSCLLPVYIAVATIVTNVSYGIFRNHFLLGLNVFLRISGVVTAVYHKQNVAVSVGLISLVAMVSIRNGWAITPIDLISIGLFCYRYRILKLNDSHQSSEKQRWPALEKVVQSKRLNINDLNQAYLCISIPEKKKNDFEFIGARYILFRNYALSRQAKVPPILAEQIQFHIDDLDGAYKTICSYLPPPNSDLPPNDKLWWEEASLSID